MPKYYHIHEGSKKCELDKNNFNINNIGTPLYFSKKNSYFYKSWISSFGENNYRNFLLIV